MTLSLKELLEFSVIVIDKPTGPTSHHVSDYVRDKLGVRKASHMGTLDPAVTGVLAITLNRACRLSPVLMKKIKTYVGIMRLHEDVSENVLQKEVKTFVGAINQLPPVRSNVKREVRTRTVYSFSLLEREGKDVLFEARVEAGTYIRTLIHDLGKKIGGAHMIELRRTSAEPFVESQAMTLYDFDKAVDAWKKGDESVLRAHLTPADELMQRVLPVLEIKNDRLKEILTGKPLHAKDLVKKELPAIDTIVCVMCKKRFIGVAHIVTEKDIVARFDFVLT